MKLSKSVLKQIIKEELHAVACEEPAPPEDEEAGQELIKGAQ